MAKVAKLYRCPICGEVLIDAEYEAMLETSSNGYCLCQFSDGERIFTEYDVYVLKEREGK